ncbi:hypothetical protein EVAR_9902_1 [Eumeta japonica]|uniref:Uncharacterized protein n=1 Tax=Eumeta variegata TaxID=151549 RepID=A0A4C1TQF8_EUMVA|nr:hypothetical protein EVAR_9902_1 [Eumeta japonica]
MKYHTNDRLNYSKANIKITLTYFSTLNYSQPITPSHESRKLIRTASSGTKRRRPFMGIYTEDKSDCGETRESGYKQFEIVINVKTLCQRNPFGRAINVLPQRERSIMAMMENTIDEFTNVT